MSFNGSGTFVINTAGQPVVSGTVISSTAFNALTADLATGLSTCITKDGQTTPTANIPMGNNKITGLAVGTAATDAANLSQVQSTTAKLVNSISGADTITGTMSPNLAAYATGQMFYFIAAGDNTGAVTLNIDSLGAKAVTRDGSVALAASDIKSGEVVVVVYDGTRFQVVSQLNSAGDARFANVSIASALNVGGVATFSAGTAAAPSITTSGDTNTGIFFPAADTIAFAEGGVESARFDSAGNFGLGVTPSAWSASGSVFQMVRGYIRSDGNTTSVGNNAYYNGSNWIYSANGRATYYDQYANTGAHAWFTAPSGSAGGTISFTQAMTLDASGNLLVGATSGSGRLYVSDANKAFDGFGNLNVVTSDAAAVDKGGAIALGGANNVGTSPYVYAKIQGIKEGSASTWNGALLFGTTASSSAVTERARITSGGDFLVGKTAAGGDVVGCQAKANGEGFFTTSSTVCLGINRRTNDGTLIEFFQADISEGSISVSGNTVSYNAFAGSHWSQLQDGSKPDILRGTVMESINELCEWPGEQNERLPKSKISDTAGSKKVYGVFMAWDNDWTETNDMYVTAVGAFICRVNGSVTVQEGDLLESNGDGTARVQADDIIRSSTIGKVTSTVKTHEYDDGSYCVPTVLYCG